MLFNAEDQIANSNEVAAIPVEKVLDPNLDAADAGMPVVPVFTEAGV